MLAFAGNSVLTRLALADKAIDPGIFVLLRLGSGAAVLLLLIGWQKSFGSLWGPKRISGTLALSLYMLGFSYAYIKLDTGVGALILFGVVQIAMFGAAVIVREPVPQHRVAGAGIAFGGLCILLFPTAAVALDPWAVCLMVVAGLGWGGYSIVGRSAGPSLPATAASFALALPLCAGVVWMFMPAAPVLTTYGALLAVLSGTFTSAMGYGLWPVVLDFAPNLCLCCFGFAISGASIGNGRGHGVFRRSTDNEICHCLRSGAEWNCAFFGRSPFAAEPITPFAWPSNTALVCLY